jgi:hypothetical protein
MDARPRGTQGRGGTRGVGGISACLVRRSAVIGGMVEDNAAIARAMIAGNSYMVLGTADPAVCLGVAVAAPGSP